MAVGSHIAFAGTEAVVPDGCCVPHCGGLHYGDPRSADPHCVHFRNE